MVDTKTPEETEFELMKKVDRKYWMDINEIFVKFGQKICKPIIPRCNLCRLRSYCRWYQEFGKRIYKKRMNVIFIVISLCLMGHSLRGVNFKPVKHNDSPICHIPDHHVGAEASRKMNSLFHFI
ncbi:MAG: endonuclease III domain-containing protein [Nitrososphaerales archaeon]